MRVLLTGASSFTGYWFARALVEGGHDLTAVFRRTRQQYEGARGRRVADLAGRVRCAWGTSFGDDAFQPLVSKGGFHLLCHHAAEMRDYRSWDFDPLAAAAANSRQVRAVVEQLVRSGCGRVIVTGSVFEPFEGAGDAGQRAFSPYGLSKHFTFELWRLECERAGMPLGKFVIPNPFGPLEERRFTSFLAQEWGRGAVPVVRTPAYVRDNIHVSLLALAYCRFCERAPGTGVRDRACPSGYVETQGAFARRLAGAMGAYFGREFPLELADQREFEEPLVRINTERVASDGGEWSEPSAWQALCRYYEEEFFGAPERV